jgi:predicted DNA-binding transcriptional regulator AlpA
MTAVTASPPDPAPLAVGAADAARMVGISRSSWLALVSAGRAPGGIRLGRRVVWRVGELSDWLEAGAPARDAWERQRKSKKCPEA